MFPLLSKGNTDLAMRKSWALKDITRHSKRIDRQDSLRKIEYKLQGKPSPNPTTRRQVKQPVNLPPIDIYYIRAVGFHRTMKQLDTTIFITSLYKIN
jgi:hypothetical protein